MLEIDLFGLASRVPLWNQLFMILAFPSATQQFCDEMVR